jgi:hypothetical protein
VNILAEIKFNMIQEGNFNMKSVESNMSRSGLSKNNSAQIIEITQNKNRSRDANSTAVLRTNKLKLL